MTAIFFLFIDPDYQVAMRDGIETTRNYTQLITSFVPAAAMEALREADPLKSFLNFDSQSPTNSKNERSSALQPTVAAAWLKSTVS